jgi:hypothetical protein
MLLADNGKDIPTQWYHDPSLKNVFGMTVAESL